MDFEWDEEKARSNLAKHGISFSIATLVFDDRQGIDRPEQGDDYGEERWSAMGFVEPNVLVVIYTLRGEKTRLISARRAEKHEREEYWQNY